MFVLEIMELAVVVVGMVGTGVFIMVKAERMYQVCRVGIRSRKTMTFRIAANLLPARFAEIAQQQQVAALKS